MFLPEYLKANNVQKSDFPRMGNLPLILAVSYSRSTPCRLVLTPNRCSQGVANPQGMDQIPKAPFSYNDTIRDYDMQLFGSTQITLNHLLTTSPCFADIRDGFGAIKLHPATALSCTILIMKNKSDNLPTLSIDNAIKDKNGKPQLYEAV